MSYAYNPFYLLAALYVLIYIPHLVRKVSKINKRVKRVINSQAAPWGLPYEGLEYPNLGFDVLNLKTYRDTLHMRADEARTWLEENPAGDEPGLTPLDRAKFWVRGSLVETARGCSIAAAILASLAWAAVLIYPRGIRFVDHLYASAVIRVPGWLHTSATLLSVLAAMGLLLWVVAKLFSRTDSASMAAWLEWSDSDDAYAVWQGKLAALDEQQPRVDAAWTATLAILHQVADQP